MLQFPLNFNFHYLNQKSALHNLQQNWVNCKKVKSLRENKRESTLFWIVAWTKSYFILGATNFLFADSRWHTPALKR